MVLNPDPYAQRQLADPAPLAGTRDQSMQRLKVGLGGLLAIIVAVGLATLIDERAQQIDATAVPQAAATVEPSTSAPKNDPLANAGVVPDLPAEESAPLQEQAIMPEQGNAAPAQ